MNKRVEESAQHPPLSWRVRLSYGAGGVLDQWGLHGFKNLANPVFNIVLGISPAFVGTLVLVTRIWDAVSDPLMGSISDNSRSAWGRRRPFILAGAILCAFFMVAAWWLPDWLSDNGQIVWLLVTGLAFYTAFTVFSVPYRALGYELAPEYHQKTQLLATRMLFTVVTSLGVAWVFPLTQNGWFGNPTESVRTLAILVGAVLLVSGLIPAIQLSDKTLAVVKRQRRVPLRESFGYAVASKPFRLVLAAAALTVIGLNSVNALGHYVNIYYVLEGDIARASVISGVAGTLYGVLVLVAAPTISGLSHRIGKRNALLVCLSCAMIGTLSKWWCYDPDYPWLQLLVFVFLAPGMAGLWMLSEAMVADISEYESCQKGIRTEAIYSAVYSWFLKTGLAVGVFLSGLILVGAGFDVAKGGDQSPETLWWLRVLFTFLPTGAIGIAILLLLRYPLTPERMRQVRHELDQSNEQASQD